MSIRKGVLGAVALLSVSVGLMGASQAEPVDFLRAVPLEISGYASAKAFPAKFSDSNQVLQALNSTPVLLVHMEALRRAYGDMDAIEQEKLLTALHKRRLTNEKDLMLGFDHGYAQLVFKQNKTGLFFLRKANDFFQDQFSALAYGMAEAEADINLESSTPDITTTRKLDVTFQLGDAVKRDAAKHQPGFWPSYVKVIDKLKPMGAYKSFSRRDFSLAYVPYGNSVVPLKPATVSNLPLSANMNSLTGNALTTACDPNADNPLAQDAQLFKGAAASQSSANFAGNNALIQFFPVQDEKAYRVRVTGLEGKPLLSFRTSAVPRRVVEDLDGDGTYEIVVRQYEQNPMLPVVVYRYTPCGFELDRKIFEDFQ